MYKSEFDRFDLSLHFNGHFSRCTWVSRYQNVSILVFIGVTVDGGGGIRCAKLQSNRHHQQTNTHLSIQAGCPSYRPTNSVKALKGQFGRLQDEIYEDCSSIKLLPCRNVAGSNGTLFPHAKQYESDTT